MTSTPRRLSAAVLLVFVLLVVSVVPWRRGAIYTGGADSVVVAKAVVAIVALGLAAAVYVVSRRRGTVGARGLTLIVAIAAVSTLGALSTTDPGPSLVLVVRLLIATATIVLVVRVAPPLTVISMVLAAMGAVAVFTALSGLLVGITDGRLAGGFPEMAPNVLAGLAGPPALGLTAYIARRGIRPASGLLFVTFVAIVLATGSRTSLLVVVVGIVLVLLHSSRLPASTAIAGIAAVPVLVGLLALNDSVSQALSRGQNAQELLTLSARTVAWEAVLSTPFDTWDKWIGVGLASKTVEVQERWRDVQVLDSSWVSSIAQAGVIGTILLAVWVIWTLADSVRNRELRAITTPLLVLVLIRSFTENGLYESSATFVLFLVLALVLEPTTRFPVAATVPTRYLLAAPLPHTTREHSGVATAAAIVRT
jgi:hypothetical protein